MVPFRARIGDSSIRDIAFVILIFLSDPSSWRQAISICLLWTKDIACNCPPGEQFRKKGAASASNLGILRGAGRKGLSTTVVDTDSSATSKIVQEATKELSAIGAKRLPVLPAMMLATADLSCGWSSTIGLSQRY
jgi:hypothetical protein